ncbi:MAG: cytolytic delta-endotoxin (insecticidal protein) [Bacteroidota bacterium]
MDTMIQAKSVTKALDKAFPSRVVILQQAEEELKFESIFAITDPKAAGAAFKMSQFFTQFVNPKDLTLNIEEAVNAIKESKIYSIIETLNTTKEQTNNSVSAMVEQLTHLFNDVLDIVMNPKNLAAVTAAIQDAFVNLAPQEGDAWIFWKKEEAHKTVYQYNILFAVQNLETGLFLYGLPMSFEITADIDKEQVLFIKLKDKVSYKVNVKSLKVITFVEEQVTEHILKNLLANGAY